ncbi:MAG: metallophosphoesterase family protein [Verrucomicrobiae bacterium]|nr:metallophosphoesterase family protein [Verrucomicrobiae bacterium]
MKIGILSDTHNLLPGPVLEGLTGVDHIIHAGDVCEDWILSELSHIAPVTAVLGNNDVLRLPMTARVSLGGLRFLAVHILNSGDARRAIASEAPDVVVFGHTHVPCNKIIESVRYFNPGSVRSGRQGHARSFAVVTLENQGFEADFSILS